MPPLRSLLLCCFTVLFFNLMTAQRVSIDYIVSTPETWVGKYDIGDLRFYHLTMPFAYADEELQRPDVDFLRKSTVYRVDMVFSDFRSSETFSQEELNRKRLERLYKIAPELFRNTATEWKLIRQMDGTSRQEASGLFHGFVFHLRTPAFAWKETGEIFEIGRDKEIDLLHSALGDTLPSDYKVSVPFPVTVFDDSTFNDQVRVVRSIVRTGLWVPVLKRRRMKGIRCKRKSIWGRSPEEIMVADTIYWGDTIVVGGCIVITCLLRRESLGMDALTTYSIYDDSVVIRTFESNPDWGTGKKVLVVEDVTGSMYPYIGQTLLWRRLESNRSRISQWAFFNDGDHRPDGPVGRSDGVHSIRSKKEKAVEEHVLMAMSKGSGGAGPENDIEAMSRGLSKAEVKPEAIVLIADNYSPVRDLSLFGRLQREQIPVYVIVCGAMGGRVNVEYLEIARRTGGKVYTMDGELEGLLELREGKTIKVGEQKYQVRDGKLVLVR